MAAEITLTSSFHRAAFQAMPNPQQAYLLLEAKPSAAAPGTGSQAVNFSMVLDRSGSMAGEKLRQMKDAAKHILDRLGAEDILSIVIFDDEADLIVPAGPVKDRDSLMGRIDSILERGGTHMSTGMQLGLQEIQRGQSPERVSSMLLLTDGQTWEDQEQCKRLADKFKASGIPIYVLGLGVGDESNWDPQLLEQLAGRSGGEWTLVDSPKKVSTVFENTLLTMKGTAVTNANLTMRLVDGVEPRTVWRVTPLISRLDHHAVSVHDVQVYLGDIQHGIGQATLADLLLPARHTGTFRLIQADITYDVPDTGLSGQKVSTDVITNFTDDTSLVNQTDQRIMNIIERVVAHRLQTQALDEAASGDSRRATQRLRAAATRLLELGEDELAQQATLQAQQLEQGGQLDQESAQRMRYATKKLTQTDMDNQEPTV
jgi:Ca-activated chloride channel family protein